MNTRLLPSHRFELYQGVSSNMRPDEQALRYLTLGQNVDTFDRFRCIGKVPGSTKVSASHGAAVRSLHYFEFLDLTGTNTRQILSYAADGVLRLIDQSTGALTTLQSSLLDGTLRGAQMHNRLHLTSPEQRTLATGGIKYDGTRTTNWGVQGPGQAETVHQSFDTHTDWTAGTGVVVSDGAASQDGGTSTSVAKTGTGLTTADIERTGLSHNFNVLGQDTLFVYVFLPFGTLQKLATSGSAIRVVLGTSGFTNINNYDFSVGELVPGWNLLSMVVNSPDSTGGAGATETNVTNIRLRLNVASAANTFSGVLWDKMFSQAAGTPSAAAGSAGSLTGTYTYRVAFLTEFGLVSNGSPSSASVTVAAKQMSLTALPVSTDTQVVARLIYRDINGDGLYRFVGQIDDNVTTTYTDNVADASLGDTDLPLAGDGLFDSTPPGRLHAACVYQNRVIGIDADDRFRLIIGDVDEPEVARIVDQLVLEESLVALQPHPYGLLLYSTDSLFLMRGDGVQVPFFIERLSDQCGANSFRSVVSIKALQMVMREAEIFAIIQPQDPWVISKDRFDHFRTDVTASTRSDGFAVHDRSRYRVIWFNKGSLGTYNQIDVWQYGTSGYEQVSGDGAGVDPQDMRVGGWFTLSLPTNVNPQCAAMVERTADSPECWIGGNDGYVYWLGDTSTATYADGTGTAAIDAQFETAAVPLGKGPGGRGTPRYLKLNASLTAQSVWTVTLTLLSDADGATVSTLSFTVTLAAGKTSQMIPIPSGYRAEWCRVKLANATTAGVGGFRGLDLFYIPRPADHRGPRSA